MKEITQTDSCPLLGLPPELRLRIYEYLDAKVKIRPTLLIMSNGHIQRTRYAKDHLEQVRLFRTIHALSMTCNFLHSDVAPLLYQNIHFHAILFCEKHPNLNSPGILDGASLILKHMRHLDLIISVLDKAEIHKALQCLNLFSQCLDQAETTFATLSVKFRVWTHHQGGEDGPLVLEDVERAKQDALAYSSEGIAHNSKSVRFRHMLQLARIYDGIRQ